MSVERRSDFINLHERMTRQETLMEGVRDDVVEIKQCIVGNGDPGLAHRVSKLESIWTDAKGRVRGALWIILAAAAIVGFGIKVYEAFAN